MIVNPQSFNYRLIIGSLIVAVTVLTVFSFTSYKSIVAHQQFLEQEKKLVQSELSQMITRYDDVSVSNDLISSQLEDAKSRTKATLDSLTSLRSDLSTLSKFKKQLYALKEKTKSIFITVDSLEEVNRYLKEEKQVAYNQLEEQKKTNVSLLKENKLLEKNIEKGSQLTANSFRAKGFENFFGKKRSSNKAKRVHTIEVCFTLAENTLAEAGEKELYVQILNPKNNVVSDQGVINFGNSSLIYSSKELIQYNNDVLEVCLDVDGDIDERPLSSGTYYISIFNEDKKLGSTQVQLK
ncbi:MAG: hypothetical protein WA775_06680 [Psychroserpens sp.]|uniref:hypothetical protein n=1 Tax=Psychroserpens sp. TaxID=2020870 RepID=UPI003C889541